MSEKIVRPSVIYEDKNFLALNKPAGLLTHRTEKGDEPALTDWLIKRYPEVSNVGDNPKIRPGIVHRLDKDTSGVILIARSQTFFEYLKKLFQRNDVKKTYLALLCGRLLPKQGVIDKPIGLLKGTVKRSVHPRKTKMEKVALTEYRVKKRFRDFTLVEAAPKTGRTHQLRVHFASVGYPIAGDKLYGPKRLPIESPKLGRQFLHAESLEFSLEDGRRLKVSADLPKELSDFLKRLKFKKREHEVLP